MVCIIPRLGVSIRANRCKGEAKKRFSALYSLSSLVSYEPFVDRCVDLFLDRLREFSHSKKEIDLGYWMQCYTFDVIGCITYGERYGMQSVNICTQIV